MANSRGSGGAVKNHGITATEKGIGTVPHVLSVAAFQRRQLEYMVGACVVLLLLRGETADLGADDGWDRGHAWLTGAGGRSLNGCENTTPDS